jgi:hypothetical protein
MNSFGLHIIMGQLHDLFHLFIYLYIYFIVIFFKKGRTATDPGPKRTDYKINLFRNGKGDSKYAYSRSLSLQGQRSFKYINRPIEVNAKSLHLKSNLENDLRQLFICLRGDPDPQIRNPALSNRIQWANQFFCGH